MKKSGNFIIRFFNSKHLFNILFWGYNICYLLFFVLLGVSANFMFSRMFGRFEEIPWNLALMYYVLIIMPIFALSLGAFTRLKKDPKKLVSFLFAVEIPIVFLALVRIMFIRQVTPILWIFLIGALIAMLGFTIRLYKDNFKNKYKQLALLISQETAVILQGYATLIALFFLPIIVATIFEGLKEIEFSWIIAVIVASKGVVFFMFLIYSLIFLLTFGFFIITPIVAIILYVNSFRNMYIQLKKKISVNFSRYFSLGFLFVFLVISVLISFQGNSNKDYYDQIDAIENSENYEDRQIAIEDLMKHENGIKNDLTNHYLAPYRYVDDSTINFILEGYKYSFDLDFDSAENIQNLFNALSLPFIYQGDFNKDTKESKELYEKIFDEHIQDGETDTIISALKATDTNDELKAGLLDKDEKTVHVVSREIAAELDENNLFAKVTFEEEYENTSDEMKEVYYEFYLPEDAVITGLWLGPDLEFEGVVSPKGAARDTYEQQVRRRVDPALLEQIGPRQYRLRVFPIPVKVDNTLDFRIINTNVDERNQRMKFEYLVMTSVDGITLPTFTEERSAYTDKNTEYKYELNNKDMKVQDNGYVSSISLDGKHSGCHTGTYAVEFETASILFVPHRGNPEIFIDYDCKNKYLGENEELNDLDLAFMIDTSYSNHSFDINKYFAEDLPMEVLVENNNIDLFFFDTEIRNHVVLTKEMLDEGIDISYYGQTDKFRNIATVPGEHDAVFMITDDSKYDLNLGVNGTEYHIPYMIHWNGSIPEYTDEFTDYLIKNRGGVYVDPQKALDDLWVRLNIDFKADLDLMDVTETGSWMVLNKDPEAEEQKIIFIAPTILDNEFKKLAAHQYINYKIKSLSTDNMDTLNLIHTIAKEYSMVSPYSSMIALVTTWQLQQLNNNEAKDDAFKTEFDTGEENLGDPSGSNILTTSGVPEPEEWALLILSVTLGCYFYRREILKWAKKII